MTADSRTRGYARRAVAANPRESNARERILEAACDLIASDGIDDVRIARVANRARASTALVHHYFSTREELLEQALLHSFETAGAERFAGDPEAETTAARRLARAVETCLPLPGAQERDWTLWVELWLRAVRDPALRPLAADLYRRYRSWMAAAIDAGLKSGEFSSERSAEEIADVAIALLDGAGIRAVIRDPATDAEHVRGIVLGYLSAELGIESSTLELAP
jgi:AcrR family transcriptional regulator